ncbi:MAG: Type 1 glutamine amidotransferase-like domain-containing protein [Bacilli bacterium]|nr:Type 1 glutamine amidotransferase-like domain-containing protein [Bacilli bacterium]
MIKILTSDFCNYEKVNGEKITRPISNENGIVDQLKESLKKINKVVFISSDINSTPESVSSYARIFFDSMKMVGIAFNEYLTIEGTNYDKASEYIEGADLVFLCGGDTYNQYKLFSKMNLKQILSSYSGIIMGQSAGALNMAVDVFNSPEEKEKSEPVFYEGLGLTTINIEPHFKYDDTNFDDKEKYQREAIIKESYNRPIYGQCNGSHIFINEDDVATTYGETYLIMNGKIEKICDNKKSVIINKLSNLKK